MEWYNSLYSELGNTSSFKCCEPGEIETVEELADALRQFTLTETLPVIALYLTEELIALGVGQGTRILFGLFRRLNRAIRLGT